MLGPPTGTPMVPSAPLSRSPETTSRLALTLERSAPAAPLALTTLLTAAAAKREERTTQRTAAVPQVSALAADDTPNVLVIGIDGTNLSKILANQQNTNLFSLMQGGTTAASTIVGHTTISNPSWSSILTGAWGEKTGVINNVFTPGPTRSGRLCSPSSSSSTTASRPLRSPTGT